MASKILFMNTGWMDFYNGIRNDSISGGGKWVQTHGWGGEIFNFKPFNGKVYGYGQPKIDRIHGTDPQIKIEKIGASVNDKFISGILVVWIATNPNGGTYIVGWYKNATVYRHHQDPPHKSNRNYKGKPVGYFISAKESDATLLPVDERIISIQRKKKGWLGQSNVWYADKQPDFVKGVQDFIYKGGIPNFLKEKNKSLKIPRQLDPLKRVAVEKSAIMAATKYYNNLGYIVTSVEKDNVGWDLEAVNQKINLKLEVKGLSGNVIAIELTPNEYRASKENHKLYRLCIVSEALTKPKLKIFSYSTEVSNWISDDGIILHTEEIISARMSI